MISRLSAFAATFAILAATTLAVAASARQPRQAAHANAIREVPLERVVVLAKRIPTAKQ